MSNLQEGAECVFELVNMCALTVGWSRGVGEEGQMFSFLISKNT